MRRAALALLTVAGTWAFSPSALNPSTLSPSGLDGVGRCSRPQALCPSSTRHLRPSVGGLRMQEDEGEEGAFANRAERRFKAKMSKKAKKAAAVKGFGGAGAETATQISESMASAPPQGATKEPPEAIKYLEKMRQETVEKREEILRNRGKPPPNKPGLPFEKQLMGVDDQLLFAVERALFFGIFAAGAVWVLAGVVTAYDSYLVATKQQVPQQVDKLLSDYAYPALTPGLVVILLFSALLGGLQVYKFEGGKTMVASRKGKEPSNTDGPL